MATSHNSSNSEFEGGKHRRKEGSKSVAEILRQKRARQQEHTAGNFGTQRDSAPELGDYLFQEPRDEETSRPSASGVAISDLERATTYLPKHGAPTEPPRFDYTEPEDHLANGDQARRSSFGGDDLPAGTGVFHDDQPNTPTYFEPRFDPEHSAEQSYGTNSAAPLHADFTTSYGEEPATSFQPTFRADESNSVDEYVADAEFDVIPDSEYGEQEYGEQDYGNQQLIDQPFSEQGFDDRQFGDQQFGGGRFGVERPGDPEFADQQFGDRQFGAEHFGAERRGDSEFADQHYGDQSYAGRQQRDDTYEDDFARGFQTTFPAQHPAGERPESDHAGKSHDAFSDHPQAGFDGSAQGDGAIARPFVEVDDDFDRSFYDSGVGVGHENEPAGAAFADPFEESSQAGIGLIDDPQAGETQEFGARAGETQAFEAPVGTSASAPAGGQAGAPASALVGDGSAEESAAGESAAGKRGKKARRAEKRAEKKAQRDAVAAQPAAKIPGRFRHVKLWSTVAGSIASLMMTLDITIVLVALPDIGKSLDLTLSGAQWVVNAYTLAFAALLLGVGSLSDLIGRRSIFILGQAIFVAASVGCMTADTESWLIISRAIQGAGGAMVFGSSLPLLSDAFAPGEEKQRTKAIAVFMAAGAAAAALGPLVGGAIVEFFSWELIFAINIPIGLFIIIVTLIGIPSNPAKLRAAQLRAEGVSEAEIAKEQSKEDTPPIDWITLVLTSIMLFSLNYAILTGPDDGWTNGKVLIGFGAALATLVVVVWIQLAKGDRAMIDVRMFSIPSFSAVTIVAFAARLFSFGMMPYIVLWLSGAVGLTSLEVGYVSTAIAGPMILFSPVALMLARKIKIGTVQALGMIVVAAGLLLGLLLKSDSGWIDIIPMYVVVGIGTGLMLPHLMDVAVSVVAPSKTGTATGIANTAFPLGTSFGVAIYGAIITATTTSGLKNLSFSTAALMKEHPGSHSLPAGATLSADHQTVTMDAPQKIMDLAASGQFEIIRQYAPMFEQKALEAYVSGLHHVLIVAAILAGLGAVVAFFFIRDKDRYEVRTGKSSEEA